MEEKKETNKPFPIKRILLIFLAVLILAAAAGWFVVFRVNTFSLEVRMLGEERIFQEYNESYTDPGAQVYLHGTLFWQEGRLIPEAALVIENSVDTNVLGNHSVSYQASYYDLTAEAQRSVRVIDSVCPQIILTQEVIDERLPAKAYLESGFQALDNHDGDITEKVYAEIVGDKILYSVIDSSGNPGYLERPVPVYSAQPPEILLSGETEIVTAVGIYYEEPGFSAQDSFDGDLTEQVCVEGEVDWLTPGVYTVTYAVTDSYENTVTAVRTVTVEGQPRVQSEWPKRKTIYLTFDDGPGPYTMDLLRILDQYGVKATFFVTDSGYNYAMKEIVRRGHSIGIHTVNHDYETIYASPEAYFADLWQMQDRIYEITGVRTTLMRFPGGSSNLVSKHTCEGIMTILTEAVQDAGFQYFDWNVDSDDAGSARKKKTVFENVKEGVLNEGTSIILQHDIHDFSVNAVEDIILWGLDHGYAFRKLTPASPGFHHGVQN